MISKNESKSKNDSIFMVNGKFPILNNKMKSKRKFETKKEERAYAILESVSSSIMYEFEESRRAYYDVNTKGGNYEKVVSSFLEKYFGGFLDFSERAQIIDICLDCVDLFPRAANNFDVVATFKTAVPRLVFKIQNTAFVPLEAVAFVVEVKQKVTKSFLKDDLDKLKKFSQLKFSADRIALAIASEHQIERPLRILIYGSRSIDDRELYELISENIEYWDILVILDNDQIWVSPSLPWTQSVFKTPQIFYCPIRAMYQCLMTIAEALPVPSRVDTHAFFSNLLLIGEP